MPDPYAGTEASRGDLVRNLTTGQHARVSARLSSGRLVTALGTWESWNAEVVPPGTYPNRLDTETHCHCKASYQGSDHCPECGCEQYESGDCGYTCTAWYADRLELVQHQLCYNPGDLNLLAEEHYFATQLRNR